MSTVETATAVRTPSVFARLQAAWSASDGSIRRSVVAALITSGVVASVEPVPIGARLATAVVGALLVASALVDLYERRLPNGLLAIALAAAVVGPVLVLDIVMLVGALAGGAIAGGSMLFVRLARGVGMGDVKAAGVVGTSVAAGSIVAAPVAVAIAALAASVYGLLARRQRIPLGPSLWLGWAVAVFGTSSGWWS